MSDLPKLNIECTHDSPLEFFCMKCAYQAAGALQREVLASEHREFYVREKAFLEAAAVAARSQANCLCRDEEMPCAGCMAAASIEGALRSMSRRSP